MADSLQVQLDALKLAYRTGATTISYQGQSISYKSGDEMCAAIASLQAEIAGAVPIRSFVVRGNKGW